MRPAPAHLRTLSTTAGSSSRAGCRLRFRRAAPRAFTLFELLLVLAVLVLVAGLAWPSLARLHAHHQLRQSADLLGVRLSSGRVHAVESGLIYQFRFEPGGRRFLLVPFDEEQVAADDPTARRAVRTVGMLPGQCKFEGGEGFTDKGTAIPDEWLSGLPDAGDYLGALWSSPVLFYPNGTATQFDVLIRGRGREQVKVSMRALTGAVTVAPFSTSLKAGG